MTVAFLAWYLLYVLLSTYAPDFMATEVFGNVNVGLLFGLAAVRDAPSPSPTSTWRTRTRSTDPIADEMRERLEGHEFAATAAGRPRRPRGPPVPELARRRGAETIGEPAINISIFGVFVADHAGHHVPRQPQQQERRRLLRGRPQHQRHRRTAWPSRATTCRRPRSSASPGPSPSTATTASSTRSASWSPGSSRCCWSPS